MTRTTPPRPIDITSVIPELAAYERTALRLHPRRGAPTVMDNSVGGPLLWPADEPWPTCDEDHGDAPPRRPVTIAGVRRARELTHDQWVVGRSLTDAEQNERRAISKGHAAAHLVDHRPTPLLPVLQLHLRDAHAVVAGPEGTDLLQVLWCPFGHGEEHVPRSRIHWRRAADVGQVLLDPPTPVILEDAEFLPEACFLHPEPVTEYPAPPYLPADMQAKVDAWDASGTGFDYRSDLSFAPGWKLGGWAPVSFRDITEVRCSCGTEMRPLLYADCREWDAGTTSWRPTEEYDPGANPDGYPPHTCNIEVSIHGDGMQIYTCPSSFSHPPAEWNQ